MNQKTKPFYFMVIALFLVLGFASMAAVAKNNNSAGVGEEDKGKKTENSDKNIEKKNSKSEESNLKNYKKADTAKGETNAQIHKEKTTQVIKKLGEEKVKNETAVADVATTEVSAEEEVKKNKVKRQIAQVLTEQENSQETVMEAIEEVENDGVAKKFFLGPDYKNLGQLRSELVHNRNQIRQLNEAIAILSQNGGDTTGLQEQLVTLTQERERIKSIIVANQSSFSLFGWVSRFLANYEETPINEEEENELIEETQETLDNADGTVAEDGTSTETTPDTNTSATTPDTTGTTPTADTTTDLIHTDTPPATGADNNMTTPTIEAPAQPAAN